MLMSFKSDAQFSPTVIGQHLAGMNLLSPLAISDEFSTVRLQHNRAFSELLHAASSSLYPQQCPGINMHNPALRWAEYWDLQVQLCLDCI